MGLRTRAQQIERQAVIAQRIKRRVAIADKLGRMPDLVLSAMQDIGGCRAVLSSVESARALAVLCRTPRRPSRHLLLRENNYVDNPKSDGYRSIHFVYEYRSERNETYNGLKIEVQIRSHLQHVWATAVETVDAFEGQGIKSGRGERDWRRFFALMGDVIARKEDCPRVPNMPVSSESVRRELARYVDRLQVEARLGAYRLATKRITRRGLRGWGYFVLELRPREHSMVIRRYKGSLDGAESAAEQYFATETQNERDPTRDVVLVKVSSLEALRSAYPNYFSDTREFLALVLEAVG
jgi:hypothetical protein